MASMRLLIVIAFALLSAVSAQYGAMEMAEGLSPRFYLGNAPQLARRQSGVCPSDEHSCLDVNATACCPNTQYCIIDSDFSPKCCDVGSDCGNACPSSLYQCQATTTISGKATVTAACCPRSCPSVSSFKCASAYGGGCCPFGYACEAGNSCSPTATASSTNAAIVSEVPSGCTTSQIACPTTMGGGCCGIGLTCTVVDNTNYCASASGSATRTGPDGILASGITETHKSSGLSSGAKAGIGAGVAVGGLVVIGGLIWFCVAHRRRHAVKSQHSSSAPAMSQAGESTGNQSRPSAGRHAGSDYFGPAAKPGPFTDDHTSPASSPGVNRGGVPISPQSPNDIAAPVEIDSRNHSNVTSPGLIDGHMRGSTAPEYPVELP